MTPEDKRRLCGLVEQWRAMARAHDQYTSYTEPVASHARSRRNVYNACADGLEKVAELYSQKKAKT